MFRDQHAKSHLYAYMYVMYMYIIHHSLRILLVTVSLPNISPNNWAQTILTDKGNALVKVCHVLHVARKKRAA